MTNELEDQDRLLCVGTNSSFKANIRYLMDISDITSYLQGIDEIRKDNNKTRDWMNLKLETKYLKVWYMLRSLVIVSRVEYCRRKSCSLASSKRECEFGVGEVGKGQIDQGMWTQKTKMLKVITEKTEKTIKKYW
nr:10543_t:CDS:2 [Entrophospora candida]